MADSAYKGKKPGFKKAPVHPNKVNDRGGYPDTNPAKNDVTTRKAVPTKRIGGSNPGAH
jgi:hypothetical protein